MVRKYEKTEIRKKQITSAARIVIIKYGSEHVTVKRIAKEVGISETDIYRHFKSKKDILSLLADHLEESLVNDINTANARGDTPLKALDNVLRSHLSAIEQRRGISFQIIAEIISLGDKKLNTKVTGMLERYTGLLASLLAEGVKSGEVRGDIDLKASATVIFCIVQGLVNVWALSNYEFDPQEKYAALWAIYREAIIRR